MSFKTAPLADVCEISMGQAPAGETYNTDGEGLPLIAGAGDFGSETPQATKFTTAPTKVSNLGDIILCIRATIGDRNWADREYCLGRGVAGLTGRPEKIDQQYMWHWLGHATPMLKAKGRGATFLQVNKADIGSMEIPVPPLPEQRRIAAILDKADALRAKRREAIAKLDQLLQSVFLDMFGEPLSNPQSWPKRPLTDVARVQTGGTPPTSEAGMFDGEIPFVTPGDLGGIVGKTNRTVTQKGAEKIRAALAGSTLVCCIGATIGKMGFVERDSTFNQQINAVTWGDEVRPLYGYHAMRFLSAEIAHRGASTTLPILKKSEFEKLTVVVPPRLEQERFCRFAQQVALKAGLLQRSSDATEMLFSSLQQHMFEV